MHAGGLDRNEELPGNFGVAAPGREEPQHIELARGKAQSFPFGDRPGCRVADWGIGGTVKRDPRAAGEQIDVLAQRRGAQPPRQLGSTTQPESAAVAVTGTQRGLGGS